jgi:hypothetical protein
MPSRNKSQPKERGGSGKSSASRPLKSLPARKDSTLKGGKRSQVKDAHDKYA